MTFGITQRALMGGGFVIFKDTFEDNDLSEWSHWSSDSNSNAGTGTSSAPDGGSYHGYVTQNSGDGNEAEIYTNNTFDWNKNYQFKFLVRQPNFNSGSDFQVSHIGWRGRKGNNNSIGTNFCHTDTNGNDRAFQFVGGGASNTTTYSISWGTGWYWIKGEVDESNATAQAKIWAAGNSEPSSYQISCDITTGITGQQVHVYSNGTSTDNVNSQAARLEFGSTLF